jgi:dTMP kinase
MEAARAELVSRVLRPELERGRVILCDRYDDSTLAYQGGGRGLDLTMLQEWNRAATGGLKPHRTLLFDLDVEVGLERRGGAGGANRLDLESAAFHRRVRIAYAQLAKREPSRFVVLDASLPADELERAVWAAVEPGLPL